MLRTLFIALGCAATVTGSAFAADMPAAVRRAPAQVYAPVATWTGFYVGANLGYASANIDPGLIGTTDDVNGIFGGAQIGYNWQFAGSPLVLGIEADIQASAQKETGLGVVEETSPWFGTVRGRMGYAANTLLLYVTGGYAFGRAEARITGVGSGGTTADGWTAGGGLEWMFAPRWSFKLEYLHFDMGRETITIAGVPGTSNIKEDLGRVGINYHF
jgi:outer membrane immunogenic protein